MKVAQILDTLLDLTADEVRTKARIAHLRSLLAEEAARKTEEEGAAPSWNAPKLGKVRWDLPEAKPVVVDDEAWLEYVRSISPEDVVAYYRVRENVLTAIVDRFERMGDHLGDPETGVVIPGVEYRQSAPRLVITLDPARKAAAIAEALDDLDGLA